MSRIDELIRELRAGDVKRLAVGEVATVERGQTITKAGTTPGNVPVLAGGRKPAYWHTTHNRIQEHVVVAGSGANAGFVSFWNQPTWVSDAFTVVGLRGVAQTKYLFYCLSNIQDDLHQMKTGSGVPHVYAKDVARIAVPIPPLPVQEEIVRVLDTFTDLEAELEAELNGRESQFDYYRNTQLTFGGDVPKLPLGEVAMVVRGASPRPIKRFMTTEDRGLPWIKIGDVPEGDKYIAQTSEYVTAEGASKSRRVMPGDFVLSNSMSFGRPYISKIEGYIHDGWLAIGDFGEYFDPDFLYHLLRSAPVQAEFNRRAGAGTVRNLNADIVKSVAVHVPGIEEQRRIVKLLDKFESLTNSGSDGLPAEIAARRKQYEYYRDRLLSFEELAA